MTQQSILRIFFLISGQQEYFVSENRNSDHLKTQTKILGEKVVNFAIIWQKNAERRRAGSECPQTISSKRFCLDRPATPCLKVGENIEQEVVCSVFVLDLIRFMTVLNIFLVFFYFY